MFGLNIFVQILTIRQFQAHYEWKFWNIQFSGDVAESIQSRKYSGPNILSRNIHD